MALVPIGQKRFKRWRGFLKMQEIIKEQGGNPNIDSEDLKPGKISIRIKSPKSGVVKKNKQQESYNNRKTIGRSKTEGLRIYLNKKLVKKLRKMIQSVHYTAKVCIILKTEKVRKNVSDNNSSMTFGKSFDSRESPQAQIFDSEITQIRGTRRAQAFGSEDFGGELSRTAQARRGYTE